LARSTDQPGSSAYFLGGVSLRDEVKRDQLGWRAADAYGQYKEVAWQWRRRRSRFGTRCGFGHGHLGLTRRWKPVGLTYIASLPGAATSQYMFRRPVVNRRQAAGQALRLLIDAARASAGKLAL
jgi:nicotinamide mononucleotide (NMN) deamidase PncC